MADTLINNALNFNEALICLSLKVNIALIIPKIATIRGIVILGYCGICKKAPRPAITPHTNTIYRNCFKSFTPKLLLHYYT